MSALPLGRYRQLLHQLLELNEQAAALRRELTAIVDTGSDHPAAASTAPIALKQECAKEPLGDSPLPPPHFLDRSPCSDEEKEDRRVAGVEEVDAKRKWRLDDECSVKSFSSAGEGKEEVDGDGDGEAEVRDSDRLLELLSLLSRSSECSDTDMIDYLLELSEDPDNCATMRRAGCVRLLVRLVHSKRPRPSRGKAAKALRNIVFAQKDDKAARREARVLRLLEAVRDYCRRLEDEADATAPHPVQSAAALMKLSFDEEHRRVMCQLGGLQSLAELVAADQSAHGSASSDPQCITMRKYSGMALTNLTFGDGDNKALLCSLADFMAALVDQLRSPDDDMRQVTAAVLRNLSWRADPASKRALRQVGAVKGLTAAAMSAHKEATLKSALSALWNLTAHCSLNKVDVCEVDGALAFLVDMLSFDAPSKTLAIAENAGGILRNVSSHVAVREDYRQILRDRDCLKVLLRQLKSPSLTVVSNSCGTLWNLSARCSQDQRYLWDRGAVPMLRSLVHSKHKMIAMGSSAALKNLLASEPGRERAAARGRSDDAGLPALGARKQRALEQEIDQSLSETCENIEPDSSPTANSRDEKLLATAERHLSFADRRGTSSLVCGRFPSDLPGSFSARSSRGGFVDRSESRDSVTSTHSDSAYEKATRIAAFPNFFNYNDGNSSNTAAAAGSSEDGFMKRYAKSRLAETIRPSDDYGYGVRRDRPVDYGKKYSEKEVSDVPSRTTPPIESTETKADRTTNSPFGDYQETDLDQPTDYSLRYCEEQSDSASSASDDRPVTSVHEDTIKHFCTEGTPYETPINFSTATSMSDLRAIGANKPTNLQSELQPKEELETMSRSDEKDSCSLEEVGNRDNDQAIQGSKDELPAASSVAKVKASAFDSKFASGTFSPEKPINYCEEGTPGYFSRDSSLSSLEGIGDNNISFDKDHESAKLTFDASDAERADNRGEKDPEVVVDNSALLNYAEETPLMFSRCSSMGSLSGCSVPEHQDDVGSVVSEFSRLPSGCISPSEIPDSPTQSPCPRADGNTVVPGRNIKVFKAQVHTATKLRSVFEDKVSTFHFEHTPIEFSTATSLSSLTIDDEPGAKTTETFNVRKRSEGVGCSDPDDSGKLNSHNSQSDRSHCDNDDIFKECIQAGVQSSLKIRPMARLIANPQTSGADVRASEDVCRTYCTEDTPALLSKAGSQSDLSVLSFTDVENSTVCVAKVPEYRKNGNRLSGKKDYSDDSSNVSGESDHLLAECIRSGMPKTAIPTYLLPVDEVENYAVEGSPFQHSLSSSLSDLTVASKSGDQKAKLIKRLDEEPPTAPVKADSPLRQGSPAGSFSSASICSDDGRLLDMAIQAGVPQPRGNSLVEDHKLDRNDSLSSLSVDSAGSNECEEALFEQCIKSGMPKINNDKWDGVHSKTLDKNFRSKAGSSGPSMTRSSEKCNRDFESLVATGAALATSGKRLSKTEENIKERVSSEERSPVVFSKNVRATSVVANDADGSAQIATSDVNTTNGEETWQCASTPINGCDSSKDSDDADGLALGCLRITEEDDLNRSIVDSTVIENEANRLAMMMCRRSLEYESSFLESGHSLDLDNVKPPSGMGSLTSLTMSAVGNWDDVESDKSKTKSSLPRGIVAKKALGLVPSLQGHFLDSCGGGNLDSVRPPSEMDDMECSMLSVASIVSEIADPPSEKNKTSLTPRQKREMSKDRYKTYTIMQDAADDRVETQVEPESPSGGSGKSSPRQRRIEDRARYQTQTVSAEDLEESNAQRAKKSIKQKRLENSERYKTQVLEPKFTRPTEESESETTATGSVASEDDSELNSVRMKTFTRSFRNYLPVIESPTSVDKCIEKNLKNIEQNGRPVDETNSLECDQNSGTESADQYQNSDSEADLPRPRGKPVIAKPTGSDASLESEECVAKGIRGRRKAYVSPYKRSAPVKKSPARTATVKGGNGLKKPVNLVAKTNQPPLKRIENSKLHSKPPQPQQPPPLVRQGTFTKEEAPRGGIPRAAIPKIPQLQKADAAKATGKVASLWKKVEESKKLQAKTDTRVWIKADAEEKKPSVAAPKTKLIRSSTFEGSSKCSSIPTPLKQKSSISIKETRQSPGCKFSSRVPVKSLSKPVGGS